MDELRELYQSLILDHSRHPHNFKVLDSANHTADGYNPLCGDQITLYMNVENDVIKDISFQGQGCAISKASTSIMTTMLKGKTISEAQSIFDKFQHMIKTGEYDIDQMGKLAVLAGVYKYPVRVKCAILPWHTAINSLESDDDTQIFSTE